MFSGCNISHYRDVSLNFIAAGGGSVSSLDNRRGGTLSNQKGWNYRCCGFAACLAACTDLRYWCALSLLLRLGGFNLFGHNYHKI